MSQICEICNLTYEPVKVSDVCFENLCPLCRFSIATLFSQCDAFEKNRIMEERRKEGMGREWWTGGEVEEWRAGR